MYAFTYYASSCMLLACSVKLNQFNRLVEATWFHLLVDILAVEVLPTFTQVEIHDLYIHFNLKLSFMHYLQWCSGGQARLDVSRHLFCLLGRRLDTSWHFLANFLVISNRLWHLNFTDCFGGKVFDLDLNNGLQILSKPFH